MQDRPAGIGNLIGFHPSAVHLVMSRFGPSRLAGKDRATGRDIRRHGHEAPGDTAHVNTSKLGRILREAGTKFWARPRGAAARAAPRPTAAPATLLPAPRGQ